MVLVTRTYGAPVDIQTGALSDLELNAVAGQKVGIIVTQNIRLALDDAGHNIINNDSLDPIAQSIRISTGGEVDWIHLSWNEGQYVDPTQGLIWYAESFVAAIVVSPGAYPVNGRNILNALSGTFLEYIQTGPFTVEARILGAVPSGPIIPNILASVKSWIMPKVDTDAAYRADENAGIKNKGVITDFQNEDRFSPMNTFAYLPMSQEIADFEVALLGIAAFIARKPEGRKQIFDLAESYMKNVTNLLTTVINSGKTHPLTALNASTEFAVLAHRFGLITDSGYLKMADQTRKIIDKLIEMQFAGVVFDGLQTFFEGASQLTATAASALK